LRTVKRAEQKSAETNSSSRLHAFDKGASRHFSRGAFFAAAARAIPSGVFDKLYPVGYIIVPTIQLRLAFIYKELVSYACDFLFLSRIDGFTSRHCRLRSKEQRQFNGFDADERCLDHALKHADIDAYVIGWNEMMGHISAR
jgi:hypothetical protein